MKPTQIKPIPFADLRRIYDEYMTRTFPKNELKPYSTIADYVADDRYDTLGLYRDGEILAYAFAYKARDCRLLDYFAALPDMTGRGYGSAMLAGLGEFFESQPVFAEIESPLSAKTEAEYTERIRWQRFYERNGFCATDVVTNLFGVEYDIIVTGECRKSAKQYITELYADMLAGFPKNKWRIKTRTEELKEKLWRN